MKEPAPRHLPDRHPLSSSRWLDDCWTYKLLQQEMDFLQPDDDGVSELSFFMVKAFFFTPVMVYTTQACAIELAVRMALGGPEPHTHEEQ